MTKQVINVGSSANSKTGDKIRTAFIKVNSNFTELYDSVVTDVSQLTDSSNLLFSGSYNDLTNKPTIPSLTGYATETYVNNQINSVINLAPETLNTLNELAAAIGNDANFSTSISTSLNNRLRVDVDNQGLTTQQKANAITNLGLVSVATSGSYNDLSGTPVLATVATSGSYNDLSGTPVLATVATSGSYNDLTNKPTIPTVPTNISAFTNDSGYLTTVAWNDVTSKPSFATVATSGSYNDLTNKPTIPSLTGYATETYVNNKVSDLVNSAPETLNTLNELALALGSDANFSTSVSTALGNRLRVDVNNQGLSTEQKSNAVTNLGLATVATSGSYNDLIDKPSAVSLTATQVGFGSATNQLTGSSDFAWDDTTKTLTLANSAGFATITNSTGIKIDFPNNLTGDGAPIQLTGGVGSTTGGPIDITAGNGDSGGSTNLWSGDGNAGSGGAVDIKAGNGTGVGSGGSISAIAGDGDIDGGNLTFNAGYSYGGNGGTVTIQGGGSDLYGGGINLTAGDGSDVGGDIWIRSGNGTAPGSINIKAGPLFSAAVGSINVEGVLIDLNGSIKVKTHTVAPASPVNGFVAFADGTSWNPGSGQGLYSYYNNTWNSLGGGVVSYNDLTNKPTLATVATTGSYNDLLDKPSASFNVPYDVITFIQGKPSANADMFIMVATRNFTILSGFNGSTSTCTVQATSSAVFTILKNGSQIGTLTFSPGSNSGVYSGAASSFVAGDVLKITSPVIQDTTLYNVSIAIKAIA